MAAKRTGKPVGRPSKLTPEVRRKIEEVAALDGTIEEMAYYADVDKTSIYNWFKEDNQFFNLIQKLRERPVLKARQSAIKHIEDNYQNAMDYLKRKRKSEFGDESTVNHTLPQPLLHVLDNISPQKDSEAE